MFVWGGDVLYYIDLYFRYAVLHDHRDIPRQFFRRNAAPHLPHRIRPVKYCMQPLSRLPFVVLLYFLRSLRSISIFYRPIAGCFLFCIVVRLLASCLVTCPGNCTLSCSIYMLCHQYNVRCSQNICTILRLPPPDLAFSSFFISIRSRRSHIVPSSIRFGRPI